MNIKTFTSIIIIALLIICIIPETDASPVAVIVPSKTTVKVGEEVTFNASLSLDNILNFTWKFGDGSIGYGEVVKHKFDEEGRYKVTLTVNDGNVTNATSIEIKVVEEERAFLDSDFVVLMFIFLATIVLVGFIGNFIFQKFSVPDVLFLLLLGIILGPIVQIFPTAVFSMFNALSPFIGGLALMILLFEGGLNLPLKSVIVGAPRATLLSIICFLLTMFPVGIITAFFLFEANIGVGLIFGAAIGGTSAAIILPLVAKMKISDDTKTILSLESTIVDVISIVVAVTIATSIAPMHGETVGPAEAANAVIGAFSIGAVIGAIFGIFWIWVLKRIEKIQYSFMMTLAAVFFVYGISEWMMGSGPISALIFGLVLANGVVIASLFKVKDVMTITKEMKNFHSEISFFIKSFFFVYIGLLVTINPLDPKSQIVLLTGVFVLIILYLVRYLSIKVALHKTEFLKEKEVMLFVIPRGLAAAVLALIPVNYMFEEKGILSKAHVSYFTDLAFFIIISTIIITTIAVPIFKRRAKATAEICLS